MSCSACSGRCRTPEACHQPENPPPLAPRGRRIAPHDLPPWRRPPQLKPTYDMDGPWRRVRRRPRLPWWFWPVFSFVCAVLMLVGLVLPLFRPLFN